MVAVDDCRAEDSPDAQVHLRPYPPVLARPGSDRRVLRAHVRRRSAPQHAEQGKPRIDLKLGGANIFILDVSQDPKAETGPAHPHQGLDHFGLEVKDIDAVCADLKAKGAVFTREPQTVRPGARIAFLTGPEGVSIELLERTPVV
jgi:catechol 2,3-dioxygenase-like lactoylglutathione lyase family enzyme